ncbi:aminoacyl tRNA synthase complex-interacting multifunctional protein 2 isoform X1 [Eurytemora carolleeae]|uniref:aminoacyl tRNA synthase complex-interacting multifunctional protein 2 isoform X1 n=1 Tax=Eurytemora carolleeae TaxID=1294199 RepID=UPI000C76A21D|nr:aminoacyl tRNA synthase complex-interacting multifunctional protein 2 isoform X1 [Eurytemora carolleeae]|eukprot:XP_023330014.1 aminoacyl tRNA synthase complex-interacting multifunctional protein 2-like isoform X1 [Eurytemora affinis]
MFRPEMLLPMGLPEGVNVIGFGLSLERPTMIKYKIDNIRDLVGHKVNLDMVKRNPICRIDKKSGVVGKQLEMINKRYDKIENRLEQIGLKLKALGFKSTPGFKPSFSTGFSPDIIIRCAVNRPPVSVLSILQILRKLYKVYTTTHTHSSVHNKGSMTLPECSDVCRGDADVRLTLIYADIPCTTLSTGNSTIQGEENAVRYLVRLADKRQVTNLYEGLQLQQICQIDSILDRLRDGSKHSVNTVVASSLSKQKFILGANLTIADILTHSLCVQLQLTSPVIEAWGQRIKLKVENLKV